MIIVSDYIGHSDENGEPMGHPIKVVNETVELLKDVTSVGIAVPEHHIVKVGPCSGDRIGLPNYICAFSNDKIGNLKKKWSNLKTLFGSTQGTPLFINVDFSLFLYLDLFARRRKYWIMLCYNPLRGVSGWRHKIIESVLKRANAVIVTNKHFLDIIPGKTIFIPDYYYIPELYKKHENEKKCTVMVCLGTMGATKKLEELVQAMNGSTIRLKIIGNFKSDPVRFQKLKEMAGDNVSLENKYVANNEYYDLIGCSEYVVLPYDMDLYNERTSGILIESVFLDSIPVAPRRLLEYNGIDGIGYENISDLPILLGQESRLAEIRKYNRKLVTTLFDKASISKQLEELC